MTTARAAFPWTLTLGLLSLGVAAAGCGKSISGYCDDICDCTRCTEEEYEECIDTTEDTQKAAEEDGCGDQFDDYLSCAQGELECNDKRINVDGCEKEATELAMCGVTGLGATCDAAIAHLQDCGFTIDPGQDNCAGGDECQFACVVSAPCSAFDGTDPNATDQYISCLDTCNGVDEPPQPGGPTGGSGGASSAGGV